MEIKATTTYNYEALKNYIRFHTIRGKHPRIYKCIYLILLIILCVEIMVCSYLVITFESFELMPLIGLLLFIIFLAIFIWFLAPIISYKLNNKNFINLANEFIFYTDEFHSQSSSATYSGNSVIKYKALHKVYETDQYFYLYINLGTAMLIDKNYIENGTPEDIRNLIQPHLPAKKYIICKY